MFAKILQKLFSSQLGRNSVYENTRNFVDFKGIVQRILNGVNTKLKSVLVNWRPAWKRFCDVVPLKFQSKNGQAPSLQGRIVWT